MTGNYGGQQGRGNVSLFSVIATPLIIIILASVLLVVNTVGLIGVLVKGGEITLTEEMLKNYKNGVYDEQFKKDENGKNVTGKNAKDSGIAIMFFYNDDKSSWEHAVQIGSNVNSEINAAFTGETSAMYKYLNEKVGAQEAKEKLVEALSKMMKELAKEIDEYELTSPFKKVTKFENTKDSTVVLMPIEGKNEEAQPIKDEKGNLLLSVADGEKLSAAMVEFENSTGVPVVMVFDTTARAFGRTIPTTDIFMVVLLVAVVALCAFNLVKKIRDYNRIKNDFGGQEANPIKVNARSPYYDEDDDEVVVDDFEAVDENEDETEGEEEETEEAEESEDEAEESAEDETKKKKSLNTESDEEEAEGEEEDEEDEGLALEDEEEDEDNGIIDGGDESYDEDEEIE